MKFKKSILALSTVGAIIAPIAGVISCGSSEDKFRTAVITDSGKVTDKSFNQSAWEAVQQIGKEKGIKHNYIEPDNENKITESYKTAYDGGSKLLVLPGFTHNKYAAQVPTGAKAIIVDGAIPAGAEDRVLTLNYKVEQGAFLAGYAAADYLVRVKKDADPKIGAWAGANAQGVSNFVLGFLEGIEAYNKAKKAHVQFAGNTLTLNTGFKAGDGATVAESLVTSGADILLGVAGSQTADGLKAIQHTDTKMIGVDVDQSLAYPESKDKFFTSIEKGIKQSVYDTLSSIYDGKDKAHVSGVTVSTSAAPQWGTSITGDLTNGWTDIAATQVSGAESSITAAKEAAVVKSAEALDLGANYDTELGRGSTGAFKDLLADLGITTITAK